MLALLVAACGGGDIEAAGRSQVIALAADFITCLGTVRAQTLDTDLRRLAWQAFEE